MRSQKRVSNSGRSIPALFAGASTLALFCASPVAGAQEAEDAPRTLSTVTVTATQRAESIQDVPLAVTALDPEALERAGVTDITGLDSLSPSFNMNSAGTVSGGTTLRIRGVGTTGNNIGLESSVGVFLDGVYLSRPGVALGDLLDLEQIEILRGPQGTLFGRNTSAGALSIKTKKPDLRETEAFGNLTVGNYNLVNVQAGINIPLIEDRFAVRLSGATHKRDGFVEGLNGAESHDRDRFLLRGQALWDMGTGGTLRAIADYSDADEKCCQAVWFSDTSLRAVFGPAGLDSTGGAPNVGPSALDALRSNDGEFRNPFEQTGFSLEYNNETLLGDLTYIGAYRDYEARQALSTDYTGLRMFTAGASAEAIALGGTNFDPQRNLTKIETTTHELRLQNKAFDDRLDWLV
ncbi:MAG: TonB-dependent receptor plug domain-containing protein, partial [Hyphomonas sp.]|nr:TonB-dependent receptor plug domain-containing protein [Hyphomonas sp.]